MQTRIVITLGLSVILFDTPLHAATFTVNTNADSGPGSLRQAILDANRSPGTDSIVFDFPAYPATVRLLSPLPTISGPVAIDATDSAGCTSGYLPRVQLDGAALVPNANGLVADGSGGAFSVTIKGLAIYHFSGVGIQLMNNVNSIIAGNNLGTDATGLTPGLGNGTGVRLTGCIAVTVGGTNACERNLLVSSADAGLELVGPNCRSNQVLGNFIGVGDGVPLSNGTGLRLNNAGGNVIGGNSLASANLIGGNFGVGVSIIGELAGQNLLLGNYIGTDAGGAPWANLTGGVLLDTGASSNAVLANVIAFNNGPGVYVQAGGANRLQQNSIYANLQLGIDLYPPGPNPNEPVGGPNSGQNFPMLANAVTGPGGTHIDGFLNSVPGQNFTIDFYWSPSCDPSGYGQGKNYLGRTNVTTDVAGNATISADGPYPMPWVATAVTATATDVAGNTSEFSPCLEVASSVGLPFPITISAGESNSVRIGYPSDPNYYFILFRGSNVSQVSQPVQVKLGTDGSDFMLEDWKGMASAFYRLSRVPIAHPLDTDGDGIHDIYELMSGGTLNPLDPLDAAQDSSGNGQSNLQKYKCGDALTDYYEGLFPLNWSLATPYGIAIDPHNDVWHAGRLKDLEIIPGGVVAVSDFGGAWLITANAGIVFPLSFDWDKPDLASITHGPDGPYHLFAGGSGLYETDVSQSFPLFNWREIPLPHDIAPIYQVLVAPYVRRVVLATEGGVIWSFIPPKGAPVSQYHWKQALGLPPGRFSSLALGPSDLITAAAWGSDVGSGRYGIFNGWWGADLNFSRSSISGLEPTGMYWTRLAWNEDLRNYMYAVSADSGGFLYGILRSTDAGQTWTRVNQMAGGQDLHDLLGGQADGWDGFISVSAHDPNRVAVGFISGPYVSTTGGASWASVTPNDNSHADLNSLHFDPADSQNNTYWLTSDGGLVLSKDFGQTLDFTYNRNLPNLECLGSTGARQWYGTMSAAHIGGDTLVVSGLQDNGNVTCKVGPSKTAWSWLGGGDGDLTMFIQPGNLLQTHNSDYNVTTASWFSNQQGYGPVSYLPVRSGNTVLAPSLLGAILEPVVHPGTPNYKGQLMYAVAANHNNIYGVFADVNGNDAHFEQLGTVQAVNAIVAVGSYDGSIVYGGAAGGRVFALFTANQAVGEAIIPLSSWRNDYGQSVVGRIVTPAANQVFATVVMEGDGALFRTLDGSIWSWVNSPGLPREYLWAMNADHTTAPAGLFVATDNRVLVSFDYGDTWKNASSGLPRRVHPMDLRFLNDGDNKRYLYASTFGRSVWRTVLADYGRYDYSYLHGTAYSGNFIQGTYGQKGNFELLVPRSDMVFHYDRDNDAFGLPWHHVACLPPTNGTPGAVSLIQTRWGTIGYPGNLAAIVRIDAPNDPNRSQSWLAYYEYDGRSRSWSDPAQVVADGQPIVGVTGDPALIQSTFGLNGNFELLVPQGGHISHYRRDNDGTGNPWHYASNLPISGSVPPTAIDAAFTQGNFTSFGSLGNFEAVVRMRPAVVSQSDYLAHYWFNSVSLQWNGPANIIADGQPANGVTGPPAIIQSTIGTQGNFEVLVPQGDHAAHYWRDNDTTGYPWHRSADLPTAGGGGQLGATPLDAAFFQGNFKSQPNAPGNFEAVVRLKPPVFDPAKIYVGFYYFDAQALKWNGPYSVSADGKFINGVTGF